MKNRVPIITICLIGAGLLAVAAFVSLEQKTFAAEPQTDPGHAAHVAAAANQAGGQTVEAQLAEMLTRIEQLEAITQQQPGQSPAGGAMPMGAENPPRMRRMAGMGSDAMPAPGGMAGMDMTGGRKARMGSGPAVADQLADLRAKMQRLEITIQQQSGSASAERPMSGMGGGSSGGGGMGMMDMDKMEMAGMMGMMGGMGGKSSSGMAMPSALPGFPGASHLYHVGATGFFLNHPQHIALSREQQMMLNRVKEKAALDKASCSRNVQEAEQDLWTLTAADQPDNAQIEAKVAEIEKLRGDARLRFIRTIGDAAKILNDEQRKSLTGFAPPAANAPAAAPMAGGMKGM
jgi:hypothetical protein